MSKIIVCDHCHDPIKDSWVDVCPTCYAALLKAQEAIEVEEEEEEKPKPIPKKNGRNGRPKKRSKVKKRQVGVFVRIYRVIFGNP